MPSSSLTMLLNQRRNKMAEMHRDKREHGLVSCSKCGSRCMRSRDGGGHLCRYCRSGKNRHPVSHYVPCKNCGRPSMPSPNREVCSACNKGLTRKMERTIESMKKHKPYTSSELMRMSPGHLAIAMGEILSRKTYLVSSGRLNVHRD